MSADINDGGPAFPRNGHPDKMDYPCFGMTLRDWFAGQALAGVMTVQTDLTGWQDMVAQAAYSLADAMIEAREVKDE